MNTTTLGILKLAVGGIALIVGALVMTVGKDPITGLTIIASGCGLAGLASGAGLIKAADAPIPFKPNVS